MQSAWILYLAIGTLVSSFVGAITLRAALHASNVMIRGGRKQAPALPFPSFDWSVTLMVIANVLNFPVTWGVSEFIAEIPSLKGANKTDLEFLAALVALPLNLIVLTNVLKVGIPTSLPQACSVVLFQVVFSVVYGIVAGAIAVAFMYAAWAIDTSGIPQVTTTAVQSPILIGGIVAGIFGAGTVFIVCLNKLEGTDDRDPGTPGTTKPPTIQPVTVAPAPRATAPEPELNTGHSARVITVLTLVVLLFGTLMFGLRR
ncbi:unnamed protein product [Gemmata massiliana]|uniref:Uncharacterized protein n=1 Tax=Gemmata massiliana TaxID=1210884 RepID=A0A6P2D413_9BACT|nr:hypothetical protein [Gemmata massiliana]VTR94844.1 unnamed protein product [Gemmata massiliana]